MLDEPTPPAGELLDRVAAELFAALDGAAVEATGRVFDEAVGRPREDDEDFALLTALRSDWALCDAPTPYGRPGESWCWRAARGGIEGLEPRPEYVQVAASLAGLFEVWPGSPTWVRDRISGVCLPLLDEPKGVEWRRRGPSGLWEMRLLLEAGGGRLCRRPLVYPTSLLTLMEASHADHWSHRGYPTLQQLRRARLLWNRNRRRGPLERFLER